MLPIVDDFVKRFKLDNFVIVADSGLINKTNISLLESGGYKYTRTLYVVQVLSGQESKTKPKMSNNGYCH